MNKIAKIIYHHVTGFNSERYWKYREIAIGNKHNLLKRCFCLYYCKRVETRHSASLGTYLGHGAIFGGGCFFTSWN